MLPVLVRIPLPHWAIPLAPCLTALAVACVLLAVLPRVRGRPFAQPGFTAALGLAVLAWSLRGRTLLLGDIPLQSYGTLLGLALIGGWLACRRLADRQQVPRETIAHCYAVATLGGLFGARFFYVLGHPDTLGSALSVLSLWDGGLSGYGGLLCGGATAFALCKRLGLDWRAWADLIAPIVAAAFVPVRIGCYLFGSEYGKPLSDGAPHWLKALGRFPHWPSESGLGVGSPAWLDQVQHSGLALDAVASVPVHPTQLYEAAFALGLSLIGFSRQGRQRFAGELFLGLAFSYGLGSCLLETTRGSVVSLSTFVDVALMLGAALGWQRLRRSTAGAATS